MSVDDLKFSKNVPDVRQTPNVPVYERQESVQPQSTPAIGSAFREYGNANNFISSIGSTIASSASTALAQKLGGEYGKNPKGNLLPPITDFDKNFKQSYLTQAQATLGLQANELITNSNIELSNAARLTPEMVEKSQHEVQIGLQNIYAQSPDEVRPQLQAHYQTVLLDQKKSLNDRLLRETKEDSAQTIKAFSIRNAEDVFTAELNNHDNMSKVPDSIVESTKQVTSSGEKSGYIKKDVAKEYTDNVIVQKFTGRYVRMGLEAEKDGKLDEYMKDLSSRPADVPEEYYPTVAKNVYNYFSNRDLMRSKYENLESQKMHNRIALNPNNISSGELADYKSKVSPIKYEQTEFALIQALKGKESDNTSIQTLIHNYGSGEAHANSSDKVKNEAFNGLVEYTQQANPHMSHEEAQVQVAASAGAEVPVFTKQLNNRLTSADPQQIEQAWSQITALRDMEAGRTLSGLSKEAEAIATQYAHKKGTMPDADLARQVTDNILNIKPDERQTLDNSWNLILNRKGAGGLGASQSLHNFALSQVNLDKSNFAGREQFAVIYGNDIYQQLRSNFDVTRGDYNAALEMTKEYVKQNYGETRVNGDPQISDKPIEKALGYKDPSVVPFIQQDFLNQAQVQFDKNKTENEHWTIKPLEPNADTMGRFTFRQKFKPAEIIRHIKTDKGEKQFTYPVMFIGRPGNSWDVVLDTPSGPRNMFLVAPHQGVISYIPNKEAIDKAYRG